MHDPRKARVVFIHLLLGMGVTLLSACVTSPSVPSVPAPSAPPTAPSTPSGQQAGAPSTPKQGSQTSTSGSESSTASSESGSQAPSPKGDEDGRVDGSEQTGSASKTAGAQKTDEQILAEALEEFERKRGQTGAGNETVAGQQDQGRSGGSVAEPGTGERTGTTAGAGERSGKEEGAREGTVAAPGTGDGTERDAGTGDGLLTDSEQARELNRELDRGFAKFDGVMLAEREAVKREDDAAGNRGFDDRDSFGGGEDEEGLQTAMVDRQIGDRPASASMKGDQETPAISTSEIPPDLVNADGDDIIARQLREAAMKEPDPELRAKLWDEYRKYKRDLK